MILFLNKYNYNYNIINYLINFNSSLRFQAVVPQILMNISLCSLNQICDVEVDKVNIYIHIGKFLSENVRFYNIVNAFITLWKSVTI